MKTCRGCGKEFEPRKSEDNLVNQYCVVCAETRREKILTRRNKGN